MDNSVELQALLTQIFLLLVPSITIETLSPALLMMSSRDFAAAKRLKEGAHTMLQFLLVCQGVIRICQSLCMRGISVSDNESWFIYSLCG